MKNRAAIGIALVIVFFVQSNQELLRFVQWWLDPRVRLVDEVSASEARLQVMRSELPPRGKVGYRERTVTNEADKRYLLTQYGLAPLFIERNASHPVVIENHAKAVTVSPAEGD